jgi:chromosome segregation ATPase
MTNVLIIVALVAVIGVLIYLLLNKIKELKNQKETINDFKNRYGGIIDVDSAIKARKEDLANLESRYTKLDEDYKQKNQTLNTDYTAKRSIFENLLKEISILEENLENISYGLYKPQYGYETSEEFKNKIEHIRNKQKDIIKAEKATYCPTQWQVGGSIKEGEKMIKQASKLMLRAFNGECDAAIAKVSWNNITNMEARIDKAFEAINKLGSTNQISITAEYKNLKLEELRLEFELEEQLYKEKEEQRRIKEQMREEEKALKEIEKAQKQAEDEEQRYQKALEKAKSDVEKATGRQLDDLNEKIKQLEQNLLLAQQQKERAMSQAQLTKSGHVYIISNIGAFGDNVFKIGMTRRLEPMDRVKELGDASVPFDFDVHAIIYSENAPELENILHKKFDEKRVNLVNARREFFNVSIDEIEQIAKELKLDFHLTKLAEAKEYRETKSIRDFRLSDNGSPKNQELEELEKYPKSLN